MSLHLLDAWIFPFILYILILSDLSDLPDLEDATSSLQDIPISA